MSSLFKSDLAKIPAKALTNKCIILDLDETLVRSNDNMKTLQDLGIMTNPEYINLRPRIYEISMEDVMCRKGTGEKIDMWGIVRPHVKQFLITCFTYFKIVIVWSAGRKKYVESIVDFLFKDIKRPHVIYTYDECDRTTDGFLVKPIVKLIQDVPGLDKYMSLKNTFILDDRLTTFKDDNPDNGILIPGYKPAPIIEYLNADDIALTQLTKWLLKPEVIASEDVRELSKDGIF